jgi:hypothetical protein
VVHSRPPHDETSEELRARALVERELGRSLDRITPASIPTVDYRLPDGSVGIEVKRITSELYNDLTSAFRCAGHLDSSELTGRWTVMVERPTLSTSLDTIPPFPPDDESLIADLERDGFVVQRKVDRVAEWRASHPGPKRRSPRLALLGDDLEPHLAVLEQYGIGSTRGTHPFGQPQDLAAALYAIYVRTNGALCHRHEPLSGQQPGVDVALSSGYTRTGRADTMVGRIDLWLNSGLSANLSASLRNEPSGTERHAVLVFDANTEPEYVSASEQGTAFCPSADLQLPPEIDVLWFILGDVACRYDATSGWRSTRAPDPHEVDR